LAAGAVVAAGAAVVGAAVGVLVVPQELISMANTTTRLNTTRACFLNIFFSFQEIEKMG
jgi:hypothetical protein